jgi:hypothetical protein
MANKKFETLDGIESRGDVTISGNVAVNTDTLFVDTTNNRVGIGKLNPIRLLDIGGAVLADAFNPGLETVSPAANVDLDFTQNSNYEITLNQNVEFTFTIDSAARGQTGMIIIHQDGTGGRTFTLPSEAKTPVGGASIVQQTVANTTGTINYFIVDVNTVLVNYIGDFQ